MAYGREAVSLEAAVGLVGNGVAESARSHKPSHGFVEVTRGLGLAKFTGDLGLGPRTRLHEAQETQHPR